MQKTPSRSERKPQQASQTSPTKIRGVPLQVRMGLAVAMLVAATAATLTYISTTSVQKNQKVNVEAAISQKASALGEIISVTLEGNISTIQTLAQNPDIVAAIKQRNASYTGSPEQILQQIKKLDTQWRQAKDSDPLIVKTLATNKGGAVIQEFANSIRFQGEVFFTDKYGATISATDRLSDYYQADEGWWQGGWGNGNGGLYVGEPEYDESAKITAVNIAVPVTDPSSKKPIGVLRTTLEIGDLIDILKNARLGQTGHAEVFGQQGNELIDGRSEEGKGSGKLDKETLALIIANKSGFVTAKDELGQPVIFAHVAIDVLEKPVGWYLSFRQDSSEAFADSRQITQNGILIGTIALLIASLLGFLFAGSISNPLRSLATLSARVGEGDLSQTARVTTDGEIGLLTQSFNTAIERLRGMVQTEQERDIERSQREQLQANIREFLEVAAEIAQGDLTKRGQVTEDMLGNVVDAVNLTIEEIGYLLSQVQKVAVAVNSGANEVTQTNQSILSGSQTQAEIAQNTNQQTAQVTGSIREMSQNAASSAQAAQQTLKASSKGLEALQNTLSGMQTIRREVQSISRSIKGLSDRSSEISEVVDTIDTIAKQTHLLALNASLEAAGAGEAGARFGVVARQVRKLAEDTAKSTQRVGTLVKGIQTEIQGLVISVDGGTREVEQGYRIANEASERLKEITDLANQSARLAELISGTAQEQVSNIERVNESVQAIAGTASQTEEQSQRGQEAAQELRNLSEQLTQSLSRFRLPA